MKIHEIADSSKRLQSCDDSLQGDEAENVGQPIPTNPHVGTASNNVGNTPTNNQNEGADSHSTDGTTENQSSTEDASAGPTTSHDRKLADNLYSTMKAYY